MNDSYMQDDQPTTKPRRRPQLAAAVGLLLAGGLAGGVLAATNSASATDTPSATSAAVTPTPGDRQGGQRDGETLLTGTNAATARAAALKAVPGGTIDRLETDADGAVYEAHMTKADGTRVTVKLDKNLKATATEEGMGRGGPGDHRGSTTATSGTSI